MPSFYLDIPEIAILATCAIMASVGYWFDRKIRRQSEGFWH